MRGALALCLLLFGCSKPPLVGPELEAFGGEIAGVGLVDRPTVARKVTRELLRQYLPLLDVGDVRYRTVRADDALRLLVFESFDGSPIPAILQTPPRPKGAVLVIPGHAKDDSSGLNEVVFDRSSYQAAAATKLAEAGFITLSFELRGFGLLRGNGHRHVAWNAIAAGSSYKAVVLRDAQYAMALLRSVSGFEPYVTGASFGGELAVTLAAIDERIPAVAVSAHGGQTGVPPLSSGEQPHYCHVIPGLYATMAREDMFTLVAPRALAVFREGRLDEGYSDRLAAAYGDASLHIETMSGDRHRFFVDETIRFFSGLK